MAVDYRKDVDGFHPINVGRLSIGLPCFVSATPAGIMMLLRHYHIATSGKKCVIIGRSNIVGKPMAQLMLQKDGGDATVTVCHSHSENLKEECRDADILIAAVGRPDFVQRVFLTLQRKAGIVLTAMLSLKKWHRNARLLHLFRVV